LGGPIFCVHTTDPLIGSALYFWCWVGLIAALVRKSLPLILSIWVKAISKSVFQFQVDGKLYFGSLLAVCGYIVARAVRRG
jgi:hypothetical protein